MSKKPVVLDDGNSMLIESLIKRPSPDYTIVPIGINPVNQTKYQFKPITAGDDSSPHVCRVHNDHVKFFMRAEGFEVYGSSADDDDELPDPNYGDEDSDFWLDIQPAEATSKQLEQFCQTILNIVPSDRDALNRLLVDYSLEVQRAQPFTSVHRRLLVAWQKAERRAINAATGNGAVEAALIVSGAEGAMNKPVAEKKPRKKKEDAAPPATDTQLPEPPAPDDGAAGQASDTGSSPDSTGNASSTGE